MESLGAQKRRSRLIILLPLNLLIVMVRLGTKAAEKEILIGAIEPLTGESVATGQFAATHNETSLYNSIR